MKSLSVVGVIVAVFGVVFTLQGFNVLKGSGMSGTTTWSVLGPIIAIAGIAMIVLSRRN